MQQLHAGQAPWWNPYLFGGYPQFTDPQAMTFQPSIVLPMLASSLPSLRWFDTIVAAHVLLGGLGAVRLARAYGLRAAPQLLFALVFMYGGVAASRMQHTPMIVSYAFLPWLWWAMRRLAQEPSAGRAVVVGIVGGLCALQMTQLTYLAGLCALVYAVMLCSLRNVRTSAALINFAIAGAIGALVCAPQWLSTFAYLPYTNRAELGLGESWATALQWPTLTTFVAGNFLSHSGGKYWGPGDISQGYLYLGAVPLVIWLAWGGAAAARWRTTVWILLAVALAAVVYALGPQTPLYLFVHRFLPGADLFRRPPDALFLFVPAVGFLAAMALQARLDEARLRPHGASLLAIAAIVVYAMWYALDHSRPHALVAVATSLLIAAIAITLLRPKSKTGTGGLAALLLLTVCDLAAHNVRTQFYASRGEAPELFRSDAQEAKNTPTLPVLLDMHRSLGAGERAELFGVPLLVNGAAVHGIAMTAGYNPWLYGAYTKVFGAVTHPLNQASERPFTPWAPDFSARAFDLLGLREVVSAAPLPNSHPIGGVYRLVRENTMPRVLNPRAVRLHTSQLPPPADYNRTDFANTVWVPATQANGNACDKTAAGSAVLGRIARSANAIDIEYRADGPAWLVLNDIIAPGWYAQVDGKELPLLRANALFRGVCVPSGSHQLRFAYSPLRLLALRWGRMPDATAFMPESVVGH